MQYVFCEKALNNIKSQRFDAISYMQSMPDLEDIIIKRKHSVYNCCAQNYINYEDGIHADDIFYSKYISHISKLISYKSSFSISYLDNRYNIERVGEKCMYALVIIFSMCIGFVYTYVVMGFNLDFDHILQFAMSSIFLGGIFGWICAPIALFMINMIFILCYNLKVMRNLQMELMHFWQSHEQYQQFYLSLISKTHTTKHEKIISIYIIKFSNVKLLELVRKNVYVLLAGMLLLCLLEMPYGIYNLIRFLAMIIFGTQAFHYYTKRQSPLMIIFGSLALLFQPLLPISLGRLVWNIVDIIVASFLTVLWYRERK